VVHQGPAAATAEAPKAAIAIAASADPLCAAVEFDVCLPA
jgi:hypothetical protein